MSASWAKYYNKRKETTSTERPPKWSEGGEALTRTSELRGLGVHVTSIGEGVRRKNTNRSDRLKGPPGGKAIGVVEGGGGRPRMTLVHLLVVGGKRGSRDEKKKRKGGKKPKSKKGKRAIQGGGKRVDTPHQRKTHGGKLKSVPEGLSQRHARLSKEDLPLKKKAMCHSRPGPQRNPD